MKHDHLILLAVAAMFVPVSAFADTETVDGIEWTYYTVSGGTATIGTRHGDSAISSETTGAITIPSALGGYRVTGIGDNTFHGCSGLISVTIPDSVTSIGTNVFYGCSGLTSVTIPDSVTSIGANAFYNCSGLTSITIPDSVTCIEQNTFYGCSGLTSVTIPSSVTRIDLEAFRRCSGLTEVHISDLSAWCGISFDFSFLTVFIPNFDRLGFSNPCRYAGRLFLNGEEISDLVIPDGVTCIGLEAFSGCSGLTSVTIGNSVTNIGWLAFEGCSGLTSVTIPDSVTSIGGCAFEGCSGLTSFEVAANNPNYSSCNGLLLSKDGTTLVQGVNGRVTIPDSVTSIEDSAFSGCSGLTSITIPDSVTSIGDQAFYGCSGLTSITIPDGVTSIGGSAFSGCSGLARISIPASLQRKTSHWGLTSTCQIIVRN